MAEAGGESPGEEKAQPGEGEDMPRHHCWTPSFLKNVTYIFIFGCAGSSFLRTGFSLVGKISRRRIWQPTVVFLPGESPWTEAPGWLQSMESQRVGHNLATKQQQQQ